MHWLLKSGFAVLLICLFDEKYNFAYGQQFEGKLITLNLLKLLTKF